MSKRKFKFIGTLHQSSQYGEPLPVCNKIYKEDYVIDNKPILYYAEHPHSSQIRQEWQEVFDEVKTPPCVGHAVENDKEEKALRYNDGKPQWSLVHFKSLESFVRVLEYGAHKYSVFEKPDGTIIKGSECTPEEALNYKLISSGRDNWKKNMVLDKILDSSQRHIAAMIDGEENDLESKLQHAGHVICNMMFYIYHNNKLKENAKT